jgi:hypothetical protein
MVSSRASPIILGLEDKQASDFELWHRDYVIEEPRLPMVRISQTKLTLRQRLIHPSPNYCCIISSITTRLKSRGAVQ